MDEIRIKAKQDYLEGMKYQDICDKYDISINTLKSWIKRYKWSEEKKNYNKKGAPKKKRGAHKKEDAITTAKIENRVEEKIIEEVAANSDLTDKQQLFCIYYLKYFNATKAYQKAYDCTYNTAMVEGHRNLRNPNIKAEIEKLKAARLKGAYLDSKDIMQKYIDIAFSDITDYISFGRRTVPVIGAFGPIKNEDGEALMQEINYIDFKESADIDGTILSEVSQGKDGVKIKLLDKMKALDWLSKNLPKINDNDLDLDRELLKARIEKEIATVGKIKKEINSDKIEPISIEIISRDSR